MLASRDMILTARAAVVWMLSARGASENESKDDYIGATGKRLVHTR